MRIYVDLDDVLAETGRTFLRVLARDFGREVAFDEVHSYNLGLSLGLDATTLTEFMHSVHRPEVLSKIELIPGALEAVSGWVEGGYEIEVVTGRPQATEGVSRQWLEAQGIPHHALTHVDKYAWEEELFRSSTGVPLSDLAGNGYCLAIEDSAEVASRLASLIPAPVVLLDRPWNRERIDAARRANGRIVRCRDWQEIRERFASP